MFETSQQEPSGGDTKVILGVVAAVVVVLLVVYFAFMRGGPATTAPQNAAAAPAAAKSAATTPVPDAKPNIDLVIEKSTLGRDSTQTMAMWDIQIFNRSHEVTYRNIHYVTNYYDGAGNVVYQGSGVLPGELAPGEERTIPGVNDGLYPVSTARYTIEIRSADAFK